MESWVRREDRGAGATNQPYFQPFHLQVDSNQRMKGCSVVVLFCFFNNPWEVEASLTWPQLTSWALTSPVMDKREISKCCQGREKRREDGDRQGPAEPGSGRPEALICFNQPPV